LLSCQEVVEANMPSVRTSVAFRLIGEPRFAEQVSGIFARAGVGLSENTQRDSDESPSSSETILALLDCSLPENAGLHAQINWILKKVEPVRGHLAELRKLGCKGELFCGLFLTDYNIVIGFEQEILAIIASHGLSLVLDVYDEVDEA
jgi:hypothetical protein